MTTFCITVAFLWQPIVTGVSLPLCVRPFLIIFYGPTRPRQASVRFSRETNGHGEKRLRDVENNWMETWKERERERVKDDGKKADPRESREGRGKKVGSPHSHL